MKIIVPGVLNRTIDHLVKENPNREFSLFAATHIEGDNVHVDELRVPLQESTGGNTEADKGAFLEELIEYGEDPARWNMWIHSHNTMGAFWSGQDEKQMFEFNKGNTPFFFHMVVSSSAAKNRKACYTAFKPFPAKWDDLEIEVTEEPENPEKLKLEDELVLAELEVTRIKNLLEDIDAVPELARTLEAELLEKNLAPKTNTVSSFFGGNKVRWKDKTKKRDSFDDYYDTDSVKDSDIDELLEKVPYNVYIQSERFKRIHALRIETNAHPVDCDCKGCEEIGYLSDLNSVSDSLICRETSKGYLNMQHDMSCGCNRCIAGKGVIRIGTLFN
jgi:hypothetical protein